MTFLGPHISRKTRTTCIISLVTVSHQQSVPPPFAPYTHNPSCTHSFLLLYFSSFCLHHQHSHSSSLTPCISSWPQYHFDKQSLGFEAVTLVPFEPLLINASMLTARQVRVVALWEFCRFFFTLVIIVTFFFHQAGIIIVVLIKDTQGKLLFRVLALVINKCISGLFLLG